MSWPNPKSRICVIPFLAIFCLYTGLFAQSSVEDADVNGQLKINRWALLNSSDEQIRIDTAVELLKNPSKDTRQVLLEILSSDNIAAQASVCKAIKRFRNFSLLIPDREDFIVPLMNILKTSNGQSAKLASQASLVFTYKQVKPHLEDIIENPDVGMSAKQNAIYALQIRVDKESVSKLINLLDSKNPEISAAAADALLEWAPMNSDKQLWRKVLKDLESKSRADILYQRLCTQEQKALQLSDDIAKWQKRYISSLDIVYQATTDETTRAKFIAENLAFEHSSVKLWAIDKITMWRKSGKSLRVDTIQKPLVALITDPDPQIRLSTAKLLGMLANVNSADALAAQLMVEVKSDVKTEILIALSRVCSFALSPGAEVKIDPAIRIQTLQVTSKFLKDSNPVAAAEVIRNLLLQNGLELAQVKPYFELIADCFKKASDEQTKSHLLEEMVRLCGNDSFYRETAGEAFGSIFLTASDDKNNQISTPAVMGLIKIDQPAAFELFKRKGFTSHPSGRIRSELILTAGQIGTQSDLEWLGSVVKDTGSEEERRQAVDAMMNIFQYSSTDVVLDWAQNFSRQAGIKKDEFLMTRTRTLFETVEKKAEAEQDMKLLYDVRQAMARHYSNTGLYEPAANYYGMLLQSATDANQITILTAELLNVNLSWGRTESARQLIANILLSEDLAENKEITKVLYNYFATNQNSPQCEQMYEAIAAINVPDPNSRPFWYNHLKKWKSLAKVVPNNPADPNASAKQKVPAEPNKATEPNIPAVQKSSV